MAQSFYLHRIGCFFAGTAHEFGLAKLAAAQLVVALAWLWLAWALLLFVRPAVSASASWRMCAGAVDEALREEMLLLLALDVALSLSLTWLFVIKSRALLALENANRNALADSQDEEEDEAQEQAQESMRGVEMASTYLVDAEKGLRAASVRRLMLRCIYLGMLAMLVTWVHLALRFVDCANLCCLEMAVNSLCVVASFDVASCDLCWCARTEHAEPRRIAYGRNVRNRSGDARNGHDRDDEKSEAESRPIVQAAVAVAVANGGANNQSVRP